MTRENSANNFLYNAGSELNNATSNYEMFFREYDPALGRMNAVDPMASKYASLTPYNYAFNDPVYYNDPLGDDARSSTRGGYSYASMGGCGCWRDSGGTSMYGSSWNYETYGGGFAKYGVGVSYGGMTGAQYSQMVRDAGNLNVGDYAVKYGTTVFTASGREMLWNPWAGSQNANGKYTGGWVGSSVHLVGLILEKGYKLKTKWQTANTNGSGDPGFWELLKNTNGLGLRMALGISDAVSIQLNIDGVGKGVGVDASPVGKLVILRGNHVGESKSVGDAGLALGSDLGVSIVITNYYYVNLKGDRPLQIEDFEGFRISGSIGVMIPFTIVGEGGKGISIAPIGNGNFIIGISKHFGVAPPTGISGNINAGFTWFYPE